MFVNSELLADWQLAFQTCGNADFRNDVNNVLVDASDLLVIHLFTDVPFYDNVDNCVIIGLRKFIAFLSELTYQRVSRVGKT